MRLAQIDARLQEVDADEIGYSTIIKAFLRQSHARSRAQRRRRIVKQAALTVLAVLILFVIVDLSYQQWINQRWINEPDLPAIRYTTLASNGTELTVGSFEYGVATRGATGWSTVESNGIFTGTQSMLETDSAARVDKVVDLRYDPQRPTDRYAWINDHGIFHFSPTAEQWQLVGTANPQSTRALRPLAVFNGVIGVISDDLGLHMWQPETQRWVHLQGAEPPLDQRIYALEINEAGVVYVTTEEGLYRSLTWPPHDWERVRDLQSARLLAVQGKDRLYTVEQTATGIWVQCLDSSGNTLGEPTVLPVTNWLVQALGQVPFMSALKLSIRALTADSTAPDTVYTVTNQGGFFTVACAGGRRWIGQIPFWDVTNTQVIVAEMDGAPTLVWASGAGIRKLPIGE